MGKVTSALKNIWERSMMHRALMVAPPVALLIWIGYVSIGGPAKAQYFTAKVDKGDISQVVQATGTINPVNSVAVGSVVSGTVVALKVDFNTMVKKGDVLAEIDPTPFQNALNQAEAQYQSAVANVASVEAQVDTARANVLNAKANIAKAQAALTNAQSVLHRTKPLVDEGVLAAQTLDDAQATNDGAAASLTSAQAQEKQTEAQLATAIAQANQAKAQVQSSKAQVASAKLQLNYCTIRAPIDGTVVNRTVNVGQPIAASLQAPNLFSIGQDLTHMLVYSNTDEADVGRIKVGARATFRVDSFPRETFYGTVSQVRMNATTVQNVVTYNTLVAFDNPDLKLFPGMTAYVSIPVAEARNVVKIPNGALRFKPDITDSERAALYAKYNIQEGGRANAAARNGGAGGGQGGAVTAGGAGAADSGAAAKPDAAGAGGGGVGANAGGGGAARGAGGAGGGFAGRQGGAGGRGAGGGFGRGGGRGGANSQREDTGIVWKLLPDKSLEPIQVGLGVTDFTYTTLVGNNLSPGDDLIIGQSTSKTPQAAQTTRNPLTPTGGQGRGPGGPGGRF